MIKKKQKLVFRVFFIMSVLVVSIFLLNWYMTHRLESYLKKMLSEKVLEASDGLYKLSFDTLSVGLFNGELLIKGVELKPDSTGFQNLLAKDSLPKTYLKIRVNSIYFQGINLTWRWSYKKLNFNLFEIQEADVAIYESPMGRKDDLKETQDSKTMYEMISPFINVLQVKEINFKNMNVSYITNDGLTPSKYGLQNVSFHAYNFIIDENSYSSGKLLYSDNFNFTTNQPQEILSNTQFSLKTSKIELNTVDSIIKIENIDLIPQVKLWKQLNQVPDSYIDAQIKTIALKGIKFTRENALNYLSARLFEVGTSDLKYFTTKRDTISVNENDTIDLSWSLYSIISPILHKVSINDIVVKDAKFKYSQSYVSDTNVYTLDKLDLIANNFLVDSLTDRDITHRFLHSENFALKASGINGITPEKNYMFGINQMKLNTVSRNFSIDNIVLGPISTNTNRDYISGSVESINIDSLIYNHGIEANKLIISSPIIEYVKVEGFSNRQNKDRIQKETKQKSLNAWSQLVPFFDHLLVRNIDLNNGNISYKDKITKNRYSLENLNFFAKNIKIDQHVVDSVSYFFASNDFGFNFQNFDSELFNEKYKLRIKSVNFDKREGRFNLRNVELKHHKNTDNIGENYVNLSIPVFDIKGFYLNATKGLKDIKIKSFDLISPQISINKVKLEEEDVPNRKSVRGEGVESIFHRFYLGSLNLIDADVKVIDNIVNDTLHSSIKEMQIKSFVWNKDKRTSINEIFLNMPEFNLVKHDSSINKESKLNQSSSMFLNMLDIRKFEMLNLKTTIRQPYFNVDIKTERLNFSNLNWTKEKFDLGVLNIQNPKIDIIQETKTKQETKTTTTKGIYENLETLSKQIFVGRFSIENANIDYNHPLKDAPVTVQRLNNTNFNIVGLNINNTQKSFDLDDITFNTKDFHFPISDGFYTIWIDSIGLSKQQAELSLSQIALIPAYPKMEFAYRSPKHKDWFDVTVGSVRLFDIDLPTYFSNKVLNADKLEVNNVILRNLKNQKIEIEHNVMPMIYEGLQNLPLKLFIKDTDVRNFSVFYEELPKKGDIASKIFLTGMNGHLEKLTNIVSEPDQFIKLNADGYFMGPGYFTAQWMIPVSKDNDCFLLDAYLRKFDLRDLNQLITPMAPVEIKNGLVKSAKFEVKASSLNATVDMLMLYNNLELVVLKNDDSDSPNKFLTRVVNTVLKKNNPNKPNKKPREPHAFVVRDPYHSTFNYFWQILQPPLVESVGISQGKQDFVKKITGAISKIKDFFKDRKEKKEKKQTESISSIRPVSDNE